MTNIFPKPPMVVFKQPSNLKKVLCHAKLQSQLTPKRQLKGMKNAPRWLPHLLLYPAFRRSEIIHHKRNTFTEWTI